MPQTKTKEYKNFQVIQKGVDTTQILNSLAMQPILWNEHNFRTRMIQSPHHVVDDILIRFNSLDQSLLDALDDKECFWYPAVNKLPVQPLISALMHQTLGDRIGRVMITRMQPGKEIAPHEDFGAVNEYYQRFHIALKQEPGAKFICGDEVFEPDEGDVFIFDNSKTHSVVNDSKSERITMIVDIHTPYFEHIKKTMKFEKKPEILEIPFMQEFYGKYSFQTEKIEVIEFELKKIEKTHWKELAVSQDEVPLDFDWQRFKDMEKEGRFHMATIRYDGELIGYHMSLIGGHLHYKSTMHAMVDLYYVLSEHRKGRTGIKFLQFVEKSLKSIGVVKIITGTKVHSDNTRIFEYLGYQVSDKLLWKIIR